MGLNTWVIQWPINIPLLRFQLIHCFGFLCGCTVDLVNKVKFRVLHALIWFDKCIWRVRALPRYFWQSLALRPSHRLLLWTGRDLVVSWEIIFDWGILACTETILVTDHSLSSVTLLLRAWRWRLGFRKSSRCWKGFDVCGSLLGRLRTPDGWLVYRICWLLLDVFGIFKDVNLSLVTYIFACLLERMRLLLGACSIFNEVLVLVHLGHFIYLGLVVESVRFFCYIHTSFLSWDKLSFFLWSCRFWFLNLSDDLIVLLFQLEQPILNPVKFIEFLWTRVSCLWPSVQLR